MNKKDVKYIRQIADRLPDVYEQTVSGYYEDYDEEGKMVLYPNVQNNLINHERRMRKAYEKLGMDGIKNYLEMIYKLQIQRKDAVQESEVHQREQESDIDPDAGDRD